VNPFARYVLSLGDDSLILSQRLCEWAARAPAIEEDVALLNIALDLLGQARALLSYAGELEGEGRDEDDLAYLRDERDFFNLQIVELENGDFAKTITRQLLFSSYQYELYKALAASAAPELAAIAAKAQIEVAYHREHAALWALRLGDGTEESHRRMERGLGEVWPYTWEMFEPAPALRALVERGAAADPPSLRAPWLAFVQTTLSEACLEVPTTTFKPAGGREGIHTEAFGYLLAEMQHLHRSHPGARW
jgi:ring-1,2-phenylacetyl-CoA epoxidase subunit PaaC